MWSDGERFETYRILPWAIDKPRGAKGLRTQQPVEGRETHVLDLRLTLTRYLPRLRPQNHWFRRYSSSSLTGHIRSPRWYPSGAQRMRTISLWDSAVLRIGLGNMSYAHELRGNIFTSVCIIPSMPITSFQVQLLEPQCQDRKGWHASFMVIAISDYAPSIIRDYVHNSKNRLSGGQPQLKLTSNDFNRFVIRALGS